MFKTIYRWFNQKKTESLYLRAGTLDDAQFVIGEVIDGARKKHFGQEYLTQAGLVSIQNMIASSVANNPIKTSLNSPMKMCRLHILEHNNIGKLGYFIALEDMHGQAHNPVVELLMAGITPRRQNQGYGRKLVEEFMSLYSNEKLYARSYYTSEQMFKILVDAGFKEIPTKLNRTRELVYLSK